MLELNSQAYNVLTPKSNRSFEIYIYWILILSFDEKPSNIGGGRVLLSSAFHPLLAGDMPYPLMPIICGAFRAFEHLIHSPKHCFQ